MKTEKKTEGWTFVYNDTKTKVHYIREGFCLCGRCSWVYDSIWLTDEEIIEGQNCKDCQKQLKKEKEAVALQPLYAKKWLITYPKEARLSQDLIIPPSSCYRLLTSLAGKQKATWAEWNAMKLMKR